MFIKTSPSVPLGVRGGEQARERPSVRAGDDEGALRGGGIEHRARVVHSLLERREALLVQAVGDAHAAPVERDQPSQRRKPLTHRVDRRRLAEREAEDVRPEVQDVDPAGPAALDAVRDVVLAALRVLDLGYGHETFPCA